ncbi:MAG: YqaA family protein [Crocinitomicaceae bacterium]
MNFLSWGLIGLYAGTFLAGTLVPFPSEALVIGAYEIDSRFWMIIIIATLGNVLGGITNYWIGFKSSSNGLKKLFKLNDKKIVLWETRFGKWGYWLGLMSWLPFIGDPMVAVLGFFKVRFLPLLMTMIIGKGLRYTILLFLYLESF